MKSWQQYLGGVALGLSAAASCGPAAAAYRNEVALEYLRTDDSRHNRFSVFSLSGTRYLTEVSADQVPFAEAAFLEHVSSISATGSWYEEDYAGVKSDGPGFGIGFTYSSPRFPVWGAISYARSDVNFGAAVPADMNSQAISGQVGYWAARGLTAGVRYTRLDRDIDSLGESSTETYDDVGAFGRWVVLLPRQQAAALWGSYTVSHFDFDGESGSDGIFSAAADYYFAPDFSLGGTVEWETGDNDFATGKTLGARAEGFFTPGSAISVSYEYFFPDTDRAAGGWQLLLGARARF